MFNLKFESGTLVLEGANETDDVPKWFLWDARTKHYRAPAYVYRRIIKDFISAKTVYTDEAKNYNVFDFNPKFHLAPRPYQTESIENWKRNERCGTIVLPTGAGKTHVATMAIEICNRQTLVVVPTLDLMNQWYDLLVFHIQRRNRSDRRRILRNRRDYGDDLRVGFSASGTLGKSIRTDNF